MNRVQLEHVLRAAGAISSTDHLIVIGSQAILGWSDSLPKSLLVSLEVDLYPKDAPGLADLIDGTIGELSPFHDTFGYYAHGVSPETATLADGWQDRLVPFANENTNGVTAWCLHPLDIAISKLAAGRPKDLEYVRTLISFIPLQPTELEDLANSLDGPSQTLVKQRLARLSY